uniref:AlNc14C76G5093 protein n=1 Tax=Albugo laibachii Nc14 TaxID=890382 RepID=F0WEP3_9STRA|nr:AlNc14C76G5093 [Albugo laibachii Nc14]|eukprot:CCA19675.1 AlNc14C76G5093 [Albugo laibachii Nc14]
MKARRIRGCYIIVFAIVAFQSQVEVYTVYATFTGDDRDEKPSQVAPVSESTVVHNDAKMKQKDVHIGNLTNSTRLDPSSNAKLAQERSEDTTNTRVNTTALGDTSYTLASTPIESKAGAQHVDPNGTHVLFYDKYNLERRNSTLQKPGNGSDVQNSSSLREEKSQPAVRLEQLKSIIQEETNSDAGEEMRARLTAGQCGYCKKVWGCLAETDANSTMEPLVYQAKTLIAKVDQDRPSNLTIGRKEALRPVSAHLWSDKDFECKKLRNCTDVLADTKQAKSCIVNQQNDSKSCEIFYFGRQQNTTKVEKTGEENKVEDAKPKDERDAKRVPHPITITPTRPPAPPMSPPPLSTLDYVPAVTVAVTEVPPVPSSMDDAETQEAQARQARAISGNSDTPFLASATAIAASGVVAIILVVVYVNHRKYDGREAPPSASQNVSTPSGVSGSEASVYNDPLETRFSSIVMITPNGNGICVL